MSSQDYADNPSLTLAIRAIKEEACADLRAENERLRIALQDIADTGKCVHHYCSLPERHQQIARKALG